jgi:hypothetical protein
VADVTAQTFTLEGVSTGAATIEVATENDLEDRFSVDVRPLARAEIFVGHPTFLGGPNWTAQDDVVLVTGGELTVAAKMYGANDAELTGYGVLTYGSTDAAIASVAAKAESNHATITAGDTPGQVDIALGEYDGLAVDVVDESAVTDVSIRFMGLADMDPIAADPAPLALVAGEPYMVVFEAKTSDGRTVAAGLSTVPTMASDVATLSHSLQVDDDNAGEDDAGQADPAAEEEEDARIRWNGAGTQIGLFTFDAPGEGELTARWMGQQRTYRIVIAPKEAAQQ